jgi:sugar (pentulose or hexulose) kinase
MHTQYYIGCDLGGKNIKAGLVDLSTGKVFVPKI